MRFKTQYNADEFITKYETTDKPSKTIPDQSLTIKQILERYARGLPLEGKTPVYHPEDMLMPDLQHMDLADRQTYLEQAEENVKDIKRKLERQSKQSKQKEAHQGPNVQRTTGDEEEQGTKDQPGQNILKKPGSGQRPASGGNEAKGGNEDAE